MRPLSIYAVISAALLLILSTGAATASETKSEQKQTEPAVPSVDEIVEKSNRAAYYQGRDGRARVTMTIKDAQGRESRRQFIILRRDREIPADDTTDSNCGEQKFYVYFQRPADVNKTVFMVWKHIERDDDRWLYLPAFDLVKRIAAGDERTSFVGSNFFYEDVSGRNVNEDIHELVETTGNFYVLKNTPKDKDSVEFSYYKAWIHRQTFIPVKIEYFDKKGTMYRVYQALKVDNIDGYKTVTRASMKDLSKNEETVLTYRSVKYNIDLPEDIFSERYLRNPPQKYMR